MSMSRFGGGLPSASSNRQITSGIETLAATGATEWVKFVDSDICVQLNGAATNIVATVQRSSTDPASSGGANTAPASATGFSGDVSAGIAPNIYTEPGVGWWRVSVGTLTGGSVTVSLSGIGG